MGKHSFHSTHAIRDALQDCQAHGQIGKKNRRNFLSYHDRKESQIEVNFHAQFLSFKYLLHLYTDGGKDGEDKNQKGVHL
jgi:hypothetical protein